MAWTGSDLAEWLAVPNASEAELLEMTHLLDVAQTHVAQRVTDIEAEPVQQAVLMVAARLWRRKSSAEGVITSMDYVSNIPSWDSDVEALIAPYRKWGF